MGSSTTGVDLTSALIQRCCHKCGKDTKSGLMINGDVYCAYCASEINKNNKELDVQSYGTFDWSFLKVNDYGNIPLVCKRCRNHPSNGGSGVCHCILGNQTTWSV